MSVFSCAWPDHPAEVSRKTLVIELHSLLYAIESGVFVIADDITAEQTREIQRELQGLRKTLDLHREACQVNHIHGSYHLQRRSAGGDSHVH